MMDRTPLTLWLVTCVLTAAAPAWAIGIGDPAPPLAIAKWLKGDPVDMAKGKGKHVYVIEFWATWCPPCLQSIPHLNHLQSKHKDSGVVVVSISQEPAQVLETFLEKMGARMRFTVAADAPGKPGEEIVEKDKQGKVVRRSRVVGKNGKTTAAYLKAFGLDGIPHAFIVDQEGRLAWHGHPMDMDKPLASIVDGSYDLAAAIKADRTRQLEVEAQPIAQAYFKLAQEGGDRKRAAELGAQFVEKARDIPSVLESFAWAILTAKDLKFRDVRLALRAAKAAYDATDGKNGSVLDTYARALFLSGNLQQAVEIQRQAVKVAENDAARALFAKALAVYEEQASKSP